VLTERTTALILRQVAFWAASIGGIVIVIAAWLVVSVLIPSNRHDPAGSDRGPVIFSRAYEGKLSAIPPTIQQPYRK
jgi:hypothetical protein